MNHETMRDSRFIKTAGLVLNLAESPSIHPVNWTDSGILLQSLQPPSEGSQGLRGTPVPACARGSPNSKGVAPGAWTLPGMGNGSL